MYPSALALHCQRSSRERELLKDASVLQVPDVFLLQLVDSVALHPHLAQQLLSDLCLATPVAPLLVAELETVFSPTLVFKLVELWPAMLLLLFRSQWNLLALIRLNRCQRRPLIL